MKKIFSGILICIAILCRLSAFAETEIVVTSGNPGNIFSDYERIEFKVSASGNVSGYTTDYFALKGDDVVWSLAKQTLSEDTVVIPVTENGSYTLRIKISDGNNVTVNETETVFSRVMSGEQNSFFQLQGHFDAYQYTLEEQMALIAKANAGGYRDHPTGWLEYDHRQNSFENIDYLKRINESSAEHGFNSNLSVPHLGCMTYTGGKDIPPTDEVALKAWGEYSAELLKATGAKRAEIWNEPNMNSLISPEVYFNIAKAATDAIKAYDETIEVGVVSLSNPNSSCKNGEESCTDTSAEHYAKYGKCYFHDLIKCGLLNLNIDAITIHSYNKNVYQMPLGIKYYRDLLDSMGRTDIKIWITEYGWYTGEANGAVSEQEQARLMVKEYLQVMAAGYAEHMAVYNLSNKYNMSVQPPEYDISNEQHNFGIVQAQLPELSENGVALSAKKAYIALSAMNAILANAQGMGTPHTFVDESVMACDFKNKKGNDVIALFAQKPQVVVLKCKEKDITLYDFYGNAKEVSSESGCYIIEADEDVLYAEGNLGEYNIEKTTVIRTTDEYAEIISPEDKSGYVVIAQYADGVLEKVQINEADVSADVNHRIEFEKVEPYFMNVSKSITLHRDPEYAKGDGSEERPYLISTKAELEAFRNKVNNGETEACAMLVNDVDLENIEWTPIGNKDKKYSGVFDGNGYEITGIFGNKQEWGLFGYTDGGEIKNLSVKVGNNGTLNLGHQSALFVAIASGKTKLLKCAGYGNLSGIGYLGGITCQGECIVTDCYFIGNIHGLSWVSGMGYNSFAENCFVLGNITAEINAFKISNGSAMNCYYVNSKGMQGTGGYGTRMNENAFASGEVAFLLGEAYGQVIGADVSPVFRNNVNIVIKKEVNKIRAFFWEDLNTMRPLAESF